MTHIFDIGLAEGRGHQQGKANEDLPFWKEQPEIRVESLGD